MNTARLKQQIWDAVLDLNSAWTVENDPKKLSQYFHKNMVAIVPSEHDRVEGGKKCVAGWMAFGKSAKILWWKELKPKIEIFGNGKFAIVTYYYDMSVEMGGQSLRLSGRDMMALVRENRAWKVVADQFSSFPK